MINPSPEFISMMTGRTSSKKAEAEPVAAPAPVAPETSAPEVDTEAEYKSAWKEFDSSLKGSITASQLRQVIASLGETITDAEVDGIVNSVDDEDKISCEFLPSLF